MTFPSKNSRLDNAPDWGERGRRKLRQLQVDTLNNFGESVVGAEILDRLDALDEFMQNIESASGGFLTADQALDDNGDTLLTDMTTTLEFISGTSNIFGVSGVILYTPTEASHALTFPTTVAPLSISGWSTVTVLDNVANTSANVSVTTPDVLISITPGNDIRVDFAFAVQLNGATTSITPRFLDAGGSAYAGSWLKAVRF